MNTYFSFLKSSSCLCLGESISISGTRYVVVERLGEGGFSVIDLVENTSSRKRYALKRITLYSLDDQNFALKEVRIGEQIDHPNVIKIVDYMLLGKADIITNKSSQLLIVLPYYKNGTVHDQIVMRAKHKTFMSESEVLQMFMGICEGVKALHEAKPEPLAHRDLKTANICLTETMDPVILDLGSCTEARVQINGQTEAQRLQDEASEKCSMVYRAPELFSVQSYCTIDERTDIWSLGCVLYAICFFKNPFDNAYEKGDSVALAVLSGKVNIPEDSPYSQDMHELILFMLRLNPMERPYIYSVMERTQECINKIENRV
ncbi:STK16 family protein [Megaselia abdita]